MNKVVGLYRLMMSTIFSQIMIRTFDQALAHTAVDYKDLNSLRSQIGFIPGVKPISEDIEGEFQVSIGPFNVYKVGDEWRLVAIRATIRSSYEYPNIFYNEEGAPDYQKIFTITEESIYPNDAFLEFAFKHIAFKWLEAIEYIVDEIHGGHLEKDIRYGISNINFEYFLSQGSRYLLGAIQTYLHEEYPNGIICDDYMYHNDKIDGYRKLSQLITYSRAKYSWADYQYIIINPFFEKIVGCSNTDKIRVYKHQITIDMLLVDSYGERVIFDDIIRCWSEVLAKQFIMNIYYSGMEHISNSDFVDMMRRIGNETINAAYVPVYKVFANELYLVVNTPY